MKGLMRPHVQPGLRVRRAESKRGVIAPRTRAFLSTHRALESTDGAHRLADVFVVERERGRLVDAAAVTVHGHADRRLLHLELQLALEADDLQMPEEMWMGSGSTN